MSAPRPDAGYDSAVPRFTDWLAEQVGTRDWVCAPKLTPNLRAKGHALAISQARYQQLDAEYERTFAVEAARIAERYRQQFGVSLIGALTRAGCEDATDPAFAFNQDPANDDPATPPDDLPGVVDAIGDILAQEAITANLVASLHSDAGVSEDEIDADPLVAKAEAAPARARGETPAEQVPA